MVRPHTIVVRSTQKIYNYHLNFYQKTYWYSARAAQRPRSPTHGTARQTKRSPMSKESQHTKPQTPARVGRTHTRSDRTGQAIPERRYAGHAINANRHKCDGPPPAQMRGSPSRKIR